MFAQLLFLNQIACKLNSSEQTRRNMEVGIAEKNVEEDDNGECNADGQQVAVPEMVLVEGHVGESHGDATARPCIVVRNVAASPVLEDGVVGQEAASDDALPELTEIKVEKDTGVAFAGMSLNVLAQVASDRLQIDGDRSVKKKPAKRAVQNMDRLDLQQIKGLSDKLIVSLFSDMTSDEIKKKYTLTCYLMPKTCQHQVTVYGNEMKAKAVMKSHLRDHIADLDRIKLEDENAEVFSSEPVPARKKRLAAQYSREIKMKKGSKKLALGSVPKKPALPPVKPKRGRPPTFPQSLQDYADLGMDVDGESSGREAMEEDDVTRKRLSSKQVEEINLSISAASATEEELISETMQEIEPEDGASAIEEGTRQGNRIRQQAPTVALNRVRRGVSSELLRSHMDKEQLIIDLMQKGQPFQDHNYTSILGRKRFTEAMEYESTAYTSEYVEASRVTARRTGAEESRVAGNQPQALDHSRRPDVTVRDGLLSPSTITVPILRLPYEAVKTPNSNTPEELVLQELTRLAEKITQKSGSYAQMVSASSTENQASSIPADEVLLSSEGEDDAVMTSDANPHRRGRKGLENSSGEWERKAALKCIRELRIRKKDDTTLVCKICKDKTFTATATLLYHYRSHAGIKPFVCLICNTTFTRQHSLNYHMLIHNNQSRFTCAECGRKFRHPSHFKEHMRRHTGETPYHCTDCPLRFKTRNTYKRHLRTRHDKLLTSCGIQKMSVEEVALNKAMQAYAIECQRPSGKDDGGGAGETSGENTENEPKCFKTIAPKQEVTQLKSRIPETSSKSLGQPLRSPTSSDAPQRSLAAVLAATVTSTMASAAASAVTTLPTASTTVVMQPCTVSSTGALPFLQQNPLACLAPMNAGQPVILGQAPSLQQVVMMPQPNAYITTHTPQVSMATAATNPVSLVTMTAQQQPLMAVNPQPAVMATPVQQPLVALATGQDNKLGQQNVLISAQSVPRLPPPVLTQLQLPTQNLNTTQFMGVSLNQNNLLQSFQTVAPTVELNAGQSSSGQSVVALSSTEHSNIVKNAEKSSPMQLYSEGPSMHSAAGQLKTDPKSVALTTLKPVDLVSMSPSDSSAPDTPAARTLLKFCSQVVNQVGQVMPPSSAP